MKVKMDMDIDDIQARKMLGIANYSPNFGVNNMTSFLSNQARMDKKELKYNSPKDLEEKDFKLSAEEEKLYNILQIDHNTVDLLNENMKLKELLRYLQSHYVADLSEARKASEETKSKIEDLEQKVKEKEKQVEQKETEIESAKNNKEQNDQKYKELYDLLSEREKMIEEANSYAKTLLEEK